MVRPGLVCAALIVAGCVAPEAPPAPRASSSVAPKSTASTAGFEDAPLPNRKMGAPVSDSIVRVAR